MDISASLARTLAEKAPPPDLTPEHAARAVRLRYVSDKAPGITRRRAGTSFAYHPRWRAIRDETKYEHMLVFGRCCRASTKRGFSDRRRPTMAALP